MQTRPANGFRLSLTCCQRMAGKTSSVMFYHGMTASLGPSLVPFESPFSFQVSSVPYSFFYIPQPSFTCHISVKAAGGNTPVASSTSSSSSKPTQRVGQAKLRKNCLLRDNYRCMLTYAYDFNEAKLLSGEEKQGLITADTQCSHVFPYSTGPKARGGELHRVEVGRR